MNSKYLIRISGRYLKNINSHEIGVAPVGGKFDDCENIGGVVITSNRTKAIEIEGGSNLKIYINLLLQAADYGDFKFDRMEITKIQEENK